jgi:hypothetical protein
MKSMRLLSSEITSVFHFEDRILIFKRSIYEELKRLGYDVYFNKDGFDFYVHKYKLYVRLGSPISSEATTEIKLDNLIVSGEGKDFNLLTLYPYDDYRFILIETIKRLGHASGRTLHQQEIARGDEGRIPLATHR